MKILVHDSGINLELAVALSRVGHKVGYHVAAADKHSRHDVALMGSGFPGIEKVDDMHMALGRSDIVVCPDTHSGDLVDWLRQKSYAVWGAGYVAERLELDRWHAIDLMHKAGVPTSGTKHVVGVPQLIKELQTSKPCFVKCCGYREVETFKHSDWPTTQEQFIAPLLVAYGTDPSLDFVLVDPVDPAVEIGSDEFVVNGQRPTRHGFGYEDKDTSYLGTYAVALPSCLEQVANAIAQEVRVATSFVSTEVRVTPLKVGYPVDLTVRAAHPVLAAQTCQVVNLAQVVVQGAIGRLLPPRYVTKYVAVLCGQSGWMTEHRGEVIFPEAIRDYVKLAKAWHSDGHYFVVPSDSYPVQVVGLGSTPGEAIAVCHYHADKVSGKDLSFDKGSLQRLLDEIVPQGRKCGVEF